IYLNVIEWGDGIWGADAAARAYFGTSAASLTASQAALMAGSLVNPRVLTVAHPTRRLLNRQRIILSRMGGVTPPAPTVAQVQEEKAIPASAPPPATREEQPVPEPEPQLEPASVAPSN